MKCKKIMSFIMSIFMLLSFISVLSVGVKKFTDEHCKTGTASKKDGSRFLY